MNAQMNDIIAFMQDGTYVVKVADKVFLGRNILHIAVFKRIDRTIYNVIYRDGLSELIIQSASL